MRKYINVRENLRLYYDSKLQSLEQIDNILKQF